MDVLRLRSVEPVVWEAERPPGVDWVWASLHSSALMRACKVLCFAARLHPSSSSCRPRVSCASLETFVSPILQRANAEIQGSDEVPVEYGKDALGRWSSVAALAPARKASARAPHRFRPGTADSASPPGEGEELSVPRVGSVERRCGWGRVVRGSRDPSAALGMRVGIDGVKGGFRLVVMNGVVT